MTDRWRGRRSAGLAVAASVAMALAVGAGGATTRADPELVVRDARGAELARVTVPDGGFALRYRNSVYGSLVEERYRLVEGGIRLVELAADERSVLEEYYGAFAARRADEGSARTWTVAMHDGPVALPLHVQATKLGERSLLVRGRPVPLWPLVSHVGDTSVTLSVEGS